MSKSRDNNIRMIILQVEVMRSNVIMEVNITLVEMVEEVTRVRTMEIREIITNSNNNSNIMK